MNLRRLPPTQWCPRVEVMGLYLRGWQIDNVLYGEALATSPSSDIEEKQFWGRHLYKSFA